MSDPESDAALAELYKETLEKADSPQKTYVEEKIPFETERQSRLRRLRETECNKTTCEEIWDGVRASRCSKNCLSYREVINLTPWDENYLLVREKKYLQGVESQESVLEICEKYGLSSFVSFVKPKRRPMNMKDAREIK